MKGADGVPLDKFPADAARTIVAMFALTSLYRLILCLLGAIALIRYRSIVALMLAVLIIEYLAQQLIFHFIPLASVGSPLGPTVNLVLFLICAVGLALSLWKRRGTQHR